MRRGAKHTAAQDRERGRSLVVLSCLAPLLCAAAPQQPSEVDRLLDALRVAPDEMTTGALEGRIQALWLEGGSPAVTLLLTRGIKDLDTAPAAAEQAFDDAILLAPDLPTAYEERGLARFRQGDDAGAVSDFEAALQREPRDFAVLADLSRLAEARENWGAAYAAWQKVLDIAPLTPGGQARLDTLRRRARGEHI